jgi:hypothetical protein
MGVALGDEDDCACGADELPQAATISTTARTATLM